MDLWIYGSIFFDFIERFIIGKSATEQLSPPNGAGNRGEEKKKGPPEKTGKKIRTKTDIERKKPIDRGTSDYKLERGQGENKGNSKTP
jgi:hypothetical protein